MNYIGKRLNKTWYELTPSEREEYVNQDYVPRSEELRTTVENNEFEDIWGTSKSEKRLIYELYFLDDMDVNEIIYHISYSRRQVFRIIKKLRDEIDNYCNTKLTKDILRLHFIYKLYYEEISNILNCDAEYARVTITSYISGAL
jgi:predicted DNA-binding protein YlxM (UPF0122 family)